MPVDSAQDGAFCVANILYCPAVEMVPLNLGVVHVRAAVLGESGYGQARSRQGAVFQSPVAGDPQLQWLENVKTSITIHLFQVFGEKGKD